MNLIRAKLVSRHVEMVEKFIFLVMMEIYIMEMAVVINVKFRITFNAPVFNLPFVN